MRIFHYGPTSLEVPSFHFIFQCPFHLILHCPHKPYIVLHIPYLDVDATNLTQFLASPVKVHAKNVQEPAASHQFLDSLVLSGE